MIVSQTDVVLSHSNLLEGGFGLWMDGQVRNTIGVGIGIGIGIGPVSPRAILPLFNVLLPNWKTLPVPVVEFMVVVLLVARPAQYFQATIQESETVHPIYVHTDTHSH